MAGMSALVGIHTAHMLSGCVKEDAGRLIFEKRGFAGHLGGYWFGYSIDVRSSKFSADWVTGRRGIKKCGRMYIFCEKVLQE